VLGDQLFTFSLKLKEESGILPCAGRAISFRATNQLQEPALHSWVALRRSAKHAADHRLNGGELFDPIALPNSNRPIGFFEGHSTQPIEDAASRPGFYHLAALLWAAFRVA